MHNTKIKIHLWNVAQDSSTDMLIRLLMINVLFWVIAHSSHSADDLSQSSTVISVEGRVLAIPEILARKSIKADSGPVENQMSMLTTAGRVLPLLSDDGGRVFFLDKSMRDRQARLKLKISPDLPYAQVVQVEIEHEGRWRIPQYYCDVCTIAVRYPQICLCCQGPMEFRFKPER